MYVIYDILVLFRIICLFILNEFNLLGSISFENRSTGQSKREEIDCFLAENDVAQCEFFHSSPSINSSIYTRKISLLFIRS